MEKSDIFRSDHLFNPNNKFITQNDIINIMKSLNINDFNINNLQYYQTAFIHKSYCKLSEYSDFKYPGAPCLPRQDISRNNGTLLRSILY